MAFGNEAIEGYQRLAHRHAPPAFRPELANAQMSDADLDAPLLEAARSALARR